MKMLLLLPGIICFAVKMYAADVDTCQPNESGLFHKAVWGYVTKVLPETIYDGKYTVFTVSFKNIDDDKKDITFTLGNIINSTEFGETEANYYFYLGKEVFIANVPDSSIINKLQAFQFHKLNRSSFDPGENGTPIRQRLYPNEGGYISRHADYIEVHSIKSCRLRTYFAGLSDFFYYQNRIMK